MTHQKKIDVSMQQMITLRDDTTLTFVNYGAGQDFQYRSEARIHNAHRRAWKSTRTAPSHRASKAKNAKRTAVDGACSSQKTLTDALTSFARDPFCRDIDLQPRSVESQWRSAFPQQFYIPRLRGSIPPQFDPEDAFLAAAKSSRYGYRNMVLFKVITSEAKQNGRALDDVFRNQAEIIRDFRALIEGYAKADTSLTQHEFQDIFSSAFSFFDTDFGKGPAYDAIQFSSHLLLMNPDNWKLHHLATVEWIRTLLPRPTIAAMKLDAYRHGILKKVNATIDFIETTQHNAAAGYPESLAYHFKPPTALYQILALKFDPSSGPRPYPEFYQICSYRILILLHTFVSESLQSTAVEVDRVLDKVEDLAHHCLQYAKPESIALFTWFLLSIFHGSDPLTDPREPFFLYGGRELLVTHGISVTQELAAWLVQEQDVNGQLIIPTIDYDGIRRLVQERWGSLPEGSRITLVSS